MAPCASRQECPMALRRTTHFANRRGTGKGSSALVCVQHNGIDTQDDVGWRPADSASTDIWSFRRPLVGSPAQANGDDCDRCRPNRSVELDPGSLCSRTFIAAMALYVDLCDCNVFNGLRTGAQCFLAAPREEGATCRSQRAHAKRLDRRTIDGTGVERHPYRRYWSSKCALC